MYWNRFSKRCVLSVASGHPCLWIWSGYHIYNIILYNLLLLFCTVKEQPGSFCGAGNMAMFWVVLFAEWGRTRDTTEHFTMHRAAYNKDRFNSKDSCCRVGKFQLGRLAFPFGDEKSFWCPKTVSVFSWSLAYWIEYGSIRERRWWSCLPLLCGLGLLVHFLQVNIGWISHSNNLAKFLSSNWSPAFCWFDLCLSQDLLWNRYVIKNKKIMNWLLTELRMLSTKTVCELLVSNGWEGFVRSGGGY